MFYVSLVLVIVAAVTLVIGLLSSGLPLVIISIASSFAAGVFLIMTVVRDRPQADAPAKEREPRRAREPVEADRTEEVREAEDFPIAEYDDLRVNEIVPLLSELDDDELELVREHEEDGKGRATILDRIDDLLEAEPEDEEWAEDELPIAEYDDLRVNEIVPLLPELDDDELELVREYEEDGKGRATILDRIDDLLEGEPAPPPKPRKPARARSGGAKKSAASFPIANYDRLTVGDVTKRLRKLDEAELKQVRTYEKRGKSRKGVLDKIEAELSAR